MTTPQKVDDHLSYILLKSIIQERRSIRSFTDQQVTIEDIDELIDCARFAPSDTNSQPWQFVVVMNKEMIQTICEMT